MYAVYSILPPGFSQHSENTHQHLLCAGGWGKKTKKTQKYKEAKNSPRFQGGGNRYLAKYGAVCLTVIIIG